MTKSSCSSRNPRPNPTSAPLTPEQQKLLEDVEPLVRGIARKLARVWEADRKELEGQAAMYAVKYVREFDGRGNSRAFVGQRVKQRLIDNLRHECSRKIGRVRSSIYHLRNGPRHLPADPSSRLWDRRFRQLRDDPSFPLRLAEAVAAVKKCLTQLDIEIWRLIESGMGTRTAAREVGLAQRTVQLHLAGMRQRIDREVAESGLPKMEIVKALLRSDPVIRARAMELMGCPAEEISKSCCASEG